MEPRSPFAIFVFFCWILRISEGIFYRRQRRKQRLELGLQPLFVIRFLLFNLWVERFT